VQPLYLALALVGTVVLLLALSTEAVRRAPFVTEPMVALGLGAALGPRGVGIVDPGLAFGDRGLVEVMRATLAVAVMAIALRLPPGWPRQAWRSLGVMLGLVLPASWLLSAALAGACLRVDVPTALLLGAILAPTDPAVASMIVAGRAAHENVPPRLRRLIAAESGANDGLALPLVAIALALLGAPPPSSTSTWLGHVLGLQVLGGLALGALLGGVFGRLLGLARHFRTVRATSYLGFTTTLALTVLGAAEAIGTSGLLAVFTAGVTFDPIVKTRRHQEAENVEEAVDRYFLLPVFVLLGAVLPWDRWWRLGYGGAVLVVGVLLLRRLPAVLALQGWIPILRRRDDALFVGWFGPIGLAALFYAVEASGHLRDGHPPELVDLPWLVATLTVTASVVVHGLTAPVLTAWYGRRYPGDPHEGEPPAPSEVDDPP
jgi:NhaP-type Na+/H+ or K+/H+ antiporter